MAPKIAVAKATTVRVAVDAAEVKPIVEAPTERVTANYSRSNS